MVVVEPTPNHHDERKGAARAADAALLGHLGLLGHVQFKLGHRQFQQTRSNICSPSAIAREPDTMTELVRLVAEPRASSRFPSCD